MTRVGGMVSFRTACQRSRPLVLAHRGGARLAPENTLAAIEQGMALGADGVECDVHLSRDGIPVVIHDRTLDRTTNATGLVSVMSAAELAAVDAGYHFQVDGGLPFRGRGVGVPTLAQVLAATANRLVIIELKSGDPALGRAVVDVVRQAGASERVCIGSFYRPGVELVRVLAPEMATSACQSEARWTLYRSWLRLPSLRRPRYVAFQVPERAGRMRVVSPSFVRRAHADGASVQVWVVDQPADVKRLFDWGVDAVISDRPDLALSARDEWVQNSSRR